MRTIKKYSNRRLYDTAQSRYVNLEELARLVISGEDVQIVDAKSGDDLTRQVLLQVALEVQDGARLFPPGLLHRIIRFGGDHPLQRAALQQVGAGLELLDAQMRQMERQLSWLEPGRATPSASASPPAAAPEPDEPEPDEDVDQAPVDPAPPTAAQEDADLAALRARLSALEQRLKGG